MTLDVEWAQQWVRMTAQLMTDSKSELTELDRQIGDGDHGENLERGFTSVLAKLDALTAAPDTIGDVLKLVATTLMSSVGGASGPLYGTAYLRAAKVSNLAVLDSNAVVALLEGALEGVTARGKATTGEKTMVDAWAPAVEAAVAAADSGAEPEQVLTSAAQAAETGSQGTKDLIATKGRASYLGERSRGHVDPGSRSTALILQAAVQAARASGQTHE